MPRRNLPRIPTISPPSFSLVFSLFFLSFCLSLFSHRARISKRVCFTRQNNENARWQRWSGAEKRVLFFPDCIFTSHSLLRALTSIACPFSIRIHYGVTGPLYEIHPFTSSSRGTRSPFDILRFFLRFPVPFKSCSFRCGNKNNSVADCITFGICMKNSANVYNWARFFKVN